MDEAERQKKQDFRDHQAELAGIENGQQERFLNGEQSRRGHNAKRKQDAAFRSLLDRLLSNPIYQATYERVSLAIDQAQEKLDGAIHNTVQAIEQLKTIQEDMINRAARLEDGTVVFLSSDGAFYTEHGRRLEKSESVSIQIPTGAPSWESYRDATDALKSAQNRMGRYSEIQDEVLTPARDRMSDPDNPPSLDELNALEKEIDRAMEQIEDAPSMAASFKSTTDMALASPEFDTDLIDDLPLLPVTKP